MRYIKLHIPLFALLALINSCDLLNTESEEVAIPTIVRVSDKYLTHADIVDILPEDLSQRDSIIFVSRYINNWIRKQLMLNKATSENSFDTDEIEKKVQMMRDELVVNEFKRDFIEENLDRSISEDAIKKHYDEHLQDYFLHQNIMKGYFVKLSKDSPNIAKFERLFKSPNDNKLEEMKSYCFQYADSQYLNDSIWFVFDDVIANTPLADDNEPEKLLKNNKFLQAEDDHYHYYFKINEYKMNDTAPFELVKDEIKNTLISKRKKLLLEKLNDDIYIEGETNNTIEKYYE